jgi:hypothetical protein
MTAREIQNERDKASRRAAHKRWYAKPENRARCLEYLKRWRVKRAASQSMGL